MADDTTPLLTEQLNSNVSLRSQTSSKEFSGSENIDYRRIKPNEKSSKSHLALAIIACILGSPLQIGLNTAILNAPEEVIKEFYNETYFDRYNDFMSDSLLTMLWAITVAFFCVGGMLGGVSAAYFAGKYGRKSTLLLNNAVAFTCAALQGCSKVSKSFEMLIAGRVVAGICCGLNSAVAPLYLAEISPVSLRGFCGTCNQLSITLGVLIGEVIGMKQLLGTEAFWPILVASPAIPAIYSLATLTFCPESPKYLLVNKGDDDAAEAALIWLRKTQDVSEEMEAMRKERVELRNSPKFSVMDLWRTSELRWPLIICIVLQMSQQFSGINAVIYYSTSIFGSAGLSKESSQYATVGTGAVNVMMTFVSALIMDRAGRRTLHMIGLGGMCIFSIVLVVCLSLQSTLPWLSYISIVAVIIYIIFFATGPGAIPWFMVAEMFAQSPRTAAVGVSVVVNWLCNFTVGIVFPVLQKAIETYSFLPFSVMLLLFFIFTYMFVPETKGKSISEITRLFKSPTVGSSVNDLPESDISYESLKNRYSTQVLIIDPPGIDETPEYSIQTSGRSEKVEFQ
ncbi:solute carrier family 2, facilitated glucose transporter member 1-like [Biomphalaria glabrata]|uniref:Solute carrier family 2, facilitated glucose transporter member 1-like n=2 Tax=Biomphalaria glabrata TaxID=6526 RepID=A0A9W2YQD9_BIOGL|nr:solute carrier family 2, facilitated glucose transporter member 1-like [Biomphalaria glabrata]